MWMTESRNKLFVLTDEETEAWKDQATCKGHPANKWQTGMQAQVCVTPNLVLLTARLNCSPKMVETLCLMAKPCPWTL